MTKYRLSVATDKRGFVPDRFILAAVGETNPCRMWVLFGSLSDAMSTAEQMIRRAARLGYLYG